MGRARLSQALRRLDLGGCVLMAIGGLIAILDRRYRVKSRASATVTTSNTQTA